MRVIAGKARGMVLSAPQGLQTRPTADRMKEALFSILAFDLPGARFLDLFSGAGAIGIEALSRGASYAAFIEHDGTCTGIIRHNLAKAKLTEHAHVFCVDVFDALVDFGQKGQTFDLIFLDPPYGCGLVAATLKKLQRHRILAADGMIIAEQSSTESPPRIGGLKIVKLKQYKTTTFAFYKTEDKS